MPEELRAEANDYLSEIIRLRLRDCGPGGRAAALECLLTFGRLERLRGRIEECEMGARGWQARMDRLVLLRAELKALEKGEEVPTE